MKKGFSFAEIIISILIFIVLLGTATFGIQKWIQTSRDTSRATDLNEISNALQTYLKQNEQYPTPFSGINIYISGTGNTALYQGYIDEDICKKIGIENKKDPYTDELYTYNINDLQNQFQLVAFFEKNTDFSSIKNEVYAQDSDEINLGFKGDRIGTLFDQYLSPIQKTLTGLDITTNQVGYYIFFDKDNFVYGTGKSLLFALSVKNKMLAKYDTGLVFYSDMETTLNSGGRILLKDFSSYENNGTCYDSGIALNCGTAGGPQFVQTPIGKAMQFDGINDYISGNFFDSSKFASGITMCAYGQKLKDNQNRGTIFEIAANGAMLRHNSTKENAYSYWEASATINGDRGPRMLSYHSSNDNKQVHFCYSRDTAVQKVYIDGMLMSGASRTGSLGNGAIRQYSIGLWLSSSNGAPTYTSALNGKADEIRVYNRALSDNEVKEIYTLSQ